MFSGAKMNAKEIFIFSILVTLSQARFTNNCESFGLKNFKDADSENNSNNVFCLNATDLTVYEVNILHDSKALLHQISHTDTSDRNKICEISSYGPIKWDCQPIVFQLNHIYSSPKGKVKRQVSRGADVLQPILPNKNVTFSVMMVEGVEWVCEQLSETQCKPLYPKQQSENKDGRQPSAESRNSGGPRAQYLTDDSPHGRQGIVSDDRRWQWGGPGGGSGGQEREEVFRKLQEHRQTGDNSSGQYVYSINGITWLCQQLDELKCYPIHNPWDGSTPPPGLSTATPPHIHPDQDREYPEYPSGQGRSLDNTRGPEGELVWEYQNLGGGGTTQKPAFKRTTFCSRSIKFIAKDEAVLSFNTYSGTMKMYLAAERKQGGLEVTARMLRQGEEGLGGTENSPHVVIRADVNCDTISLDIDGAVFKLDYGFGRLGVKDLEVLGNLESTGMVPRERKEKPRRGSVRNFLEPQDFSSINLRPSPVDSDETIRDEFENSEDSGDLDIPVTEDSYQIEGQGDVEVSLGEASQTQHRYQISRGQDGEVNIDVVVEDSEARGEERDIVIDNKDYNYTLIISGQNIQVIHHDTNRNLTYRHGLDENQISGVGVLGDLRGSSTSFKQPDQEKATESPRSFPTASPKKPSKMVSVYGELCLDTCQPSTDNRHYCPVYGGGRQQCGPAPGHTPQGDPCEDECRKRNDEYFWCQRAGAPWDYCSPRLVFQQHLNCPGDSERLTVPDPASCARFLSCEAGSVKLEECPDGLHYIHRNKTCEWPVDGGQCGVFSRSDTTTTTLTSPSTSAPEDRQPPLSLARTDPVFRIPDDYIYFDEDDILSVPDIPQPRPPGRVRFPTNKDTSSSPQPSTFANIQPRVKQTPTSLRPTKIPLITSTTPIFVETETNRSFPRSLFQEDGNSENSIDFGQTFTSTQAPSVGRTTFQTTQNYDDLNSNKDEMDIEEIIERSRDFKYGLTSHGELCTDECAKRGYPYFWCHKPSSSLGQWWDSDFCSPSPSSTHYGKECEDECQQRGEKYFWCTRKVDGGWGYCSPQTVFTQDSCLRDDKQLYAIVGDCDHYIQCRGQTPVLSSCESPLHFDYILRSCTFEKDARCIGDVDVQ